MSRQAQAPTIVLFRRDLRIGDNAALAAAADRGAPVVALYILDETTKGLRAMGAASRWWLHHSLAALGDLLRKAGANLFLAHGRTEDAVAKAIDASGANCVFWNRRYDPSEAGVDARLKAALREKGLTALSFDGALLHEPSHLKTGSGGFYKVYTPFWKAMAEEVHVRDPIDPPGSIDGWTLSIRSASISAIAGRATSSRSTFGQRHSYLIPVGDRHDETVRQHCDKRFYVSPFMAMGLNYRFRIGLPDENVAIHITASDDQGPLMVASFAGKRRALSDASLLRAFISYPLLTLKVTVGIHWEALRLWAKGIRLQERPAPPHHSITHVAMDGRLRAKAEPDTI